MVAGPEIFMCHIVNSNFAEVLTDLPLNRTVSRVSNPTSVFCMLYFGRQGQLWNETTRKLSNLPLHLTYKVLSQPLAGIQVRTYEAFNIAACRRCFFFGTSLFKVTALVTPEPVTPLGD